METDAVYSGCSQTSKFFLTMFQTTRVTDMSGSRSRRMALLRTLTITFGLKGRAPTKISRPTTG